jgi:hypothetical protein
MCNEVERIQYFIPQWEDKSVQELFPDLYVKPKFQYQNVFPRHCMICKRSVEDEDMWPPGRCPRSMCEDCYQRKIVGVINERCIISGDLLPKYKTDAQFLNPRDVENNIADGPARDYYTLLACKVVGLDMSFVKNDVQTLLSVSTGNYHENYDAINADCRVVAQHPPRCVHKPSLPSARLLEDTSHARVPIGRKIKYIPKIKKIW